jgi:DNA (cytosine-5)-methyltransferase 1
MRKLRAVSLFSNCGAGDIGYAKAGFRFEVMAELDPDRLKVCLRNHRKAKGVAGDLRITWPQVVSEYRTVAGDERPSLLCACPPCQGMSSARSGRGKHEDAAAGSADERNLLVTVIANVAHALKPDIIVVENVTAFLTRRVWHPEDGKPISAANYLISKLAADYDVFPLVAELADYGVPQSRVRSFLTLVRKELPGLKRLVGSARAPFPAPTHASDSSAFTKQVTLQQALDSYNLPPLDAATSDSAVAPGYSGLHSVPVWPKRIYDMVAAIPPKSGKSAWVTSKCIHCGPVDVDGSAVACPVCDETLPRPVIVEHDGTRRLIRGFASSYRRMHAERPAATVTTASGHVGSDYTIHPTENRLLSILECALLQTFPIEFDWGDALKRKGSTNVREMIGEAVPPLFTELHGRVLSSLLKGRLPRRAILATNAKCESGRAKLRQASKKDGRLEFETA